MEFTIVSSMRFMSLSLLVIAVLSPCVLARKWNDTGKGTIIFEEAWTVPELIDQTAGTAPPVGQTLTDLQDNLLDIHNQRLARMDASGVDFMVLSCAAPCIQGISDNQTAAAMATKVNDDLAAAIANNTMRFGAFATLDMHDPAGAAAELERVVNKYGFLGALINDYQQTGADNSTLLYYDQPAYDVFWQKAQDMDVPVYLHPRPPAPVMTALEYAHSPWIIGSPQQFAVMLSNHIMGITANGVFDRFPNLKLVVGHLGERIPSDLWRIDDQINRERSVGMPMQQTVTYYWKKNIWETTSGNFATVLLAEHAETIGIDRILYSVDYPYVPMEQGAAWFNNLTLSQETRENLARNNAISLLGLNK